MMKPVHRIYADGVSPEQGKVVYDYPKMICVLVKLNRTLF